MAIGDVSGDGKPDLAVANTGQSTVSVLLGDGAGGFGAKTDFSSGLNPFSGAIGDVSGDGKPDLAVANGSANTVSVLLGDGAGGFGTKTDFATGLQPRSVAIGDVSGDGKPDLVVANLNSNTVSVLLGTCGVVGVEPASPVASVRIAGGPNPFGDKITIQFELARAQHVRLAIFDLWGRRLRDLASGLLPAGNYRVVWNGLNDGGRAVSAGIYFARLDLPGRSLRTKVVRLH